MQDFREAVRITLKSGNQEPESRLTTAKRKPPHVFPDFRLVPQADSRLISDGAPQLVRFVHIGDVQAATTLRLTSSRHNFRF